jgi:hypothetical protein
MKKFKIQLKENKTFIDEFNTMEQALIELKLYELYDHKDGVYTPNSYEIVENEPKKIKLTKELN